ncbi:SH3 domain-containing protein [Enteractinococcus helveticum]|nr:SH3 domain-containing protein [Enteractinococcus helveticum]
MDADQKPAPVQGEDTQVISVDGVDEEALPDSDEELYEQPSPEISQESEPSVTSEATPQAEDDGESEQPESLGTDAQTDEASDAPDTVETSGPETVQPSPENASPTEATQNQKSAEEQQLAETAIEDSEGTLAALTTPVESIDFIAAGITWDSNTSEDITEAALRVRKQGEWSEWHDLEVHATDEEMKAHSPRAGTEPLITLKADAVQARVHTRSGKAPEGLEVSLIDPGESATDGQLEPASIESTDVKTIDDASTASTTRPLDNATTEPDQPTGAKMMRSVSARTPLQTARSNSSADVIKPAIVTRAQWGANESLVSRSNQSSELKAMYVHHTAGTNNYSRAQAYAQVRAVHNYHAGTLRWGDIGYNFLIDRYGTIYEGRRGSIDSLPVGAQAGGFNTNTFGISTIGNFEIASPPAAMVESLKKVLAWKGLQHGINAAGTTSLTSAGGSSKHSSGTRVTVNTILGHKDTHATACPGRYLYSQLPSIRRDVATRINNAKTTTSFPTRKITAGLAYRAQKATTLRAEPNTKASTIQSLAHGSRVTTTNLASSGWWRVTYNGKTGWVPYKDLISNSKYTPPITYRTIASGLAYRAQKATVLRTDPNVKAATVQRLSQGARVTTTNRASGSWWRVTYNGKTGWVPYKDLISNSKYKAPVAYRTITSGLAYRAQRTTTLRTAPNSTATTVQRLSRGARVSTTNRAIGNWWRVTHNGKTGWVPYKDLIRNSQYR